MFDAAVGAMVYIKDPSQDILKTAAKHLRYTNPAYVRQVRFGSYYGVKAPKFIHGEIVEEHGVWVPRSWFFKTLYGTESFRITTKTTELAADFPVPLITPRPEQYAALDALVRTINDNDNVGLPTDTYIVMPPGEGKTILGMLACFACKQKALVVVPTQEIESGWISDVKAVFGDRLAVGRIRGNRIDTEHPLTVGSIQTLMKLDPKLWASKFGVVIFDELHRLGAEVFANTVRRCTAHIRFGLTATDFRKDGRFVGVRWHMGDPCFRSESRNNTVPLHYHAVMTPYGLLRNKDDFDFNELLSDLQNNRHRTNTIVSLVDHIKANYPGDILIVSPRTEHIALIVAALSDDPGNTVAVITSATRDRKALFQQVKSGKYKITIATTSIMSEGASNSRWHHVISTMPFSDPKTAIQLSGRANRCEPSKTCGYFWDLVDTNPMCRAMYKNRWRTLKKFLASTKVFTADGTSPYSITEKRVSP